MYLKEKLKTGRCVVGAMLNLIYNPDVIRIYAESGLDYCVVDCEHAAYTFREVNGFLSVAKGIGFPVLVRIPQVDRSYVQRMLEVGAEGFMIPGAKTPEMMAETVRLSKFPPDGERGIGGGIVQDFKSVDEVLWSKEQNENVFIMAQIEHKSAVENIDAILGVKGVDAVIFGPRDLSNDLGILGQTNHPDILACFESVLASAGRNNVTKGFFVAGDAGGMQWGIDRGARMLLWSNDVSALQKHLSAGVKTIRSLNGFVG